MVSRIASILNVFYLGGARGIGLAVAAAYAEAGAKVCPALSLLPILFVSEVLTLFLDRNSLSHNYNRTKGCR